MTNQPQLIADYACVCGEGPLFLPTENAVLWTDIETGRLFRLDLATKTHEQIYSGQKVGGFTSQADGSLLLFQERGRVSHWRNGETETLIESLPNEGSRWNDVYADPEGRIFCGTMPSDGHPGRLYRLDRDGSIRIILEDIGCSNGMGFSPDLKTMYYTDSPAHHIYAFDYDRATGEISNQRVHVETEGEGVPDGMRVDANGDIWSARWGGSALFHYDTSGKLVESVSIPAPKVTSLCFGGDNYATAFVSTAGGNAKDKDGEGAGGLFQI
ncbi:MAG TPA: SMP-30/gluconolactonase/LRE family protein, partial [Abditibacteriaceae bacterium]|nr:SMP-30/gluconolactonase/LRE family protein [Abditibacteriaceae bacterium]